MAELQSVKEKETMLQCYSLEKNSGNQIGVEGALQIDIAVDPLECTNNCADNTPNSIAVLAAARGDLLHAPDCYMDKIAAGPELAGQISLDGG